MLIDFCDANLGLTGFKHYPATVLVPHTLDKGESHPEQMLEILPLGFINRLSPPLVLFRNLEVEGPKKRNKEMG